MAESSAARPDWVECITRTDGGNETWCGRDAVGFAFDGLEHAALNGLQGGRMVACTQCVDSALKALRAGTPEAGAAPIGWTWTYMGMRHFTGHREVAEQIAATATELAQPVEVRPIGVVGEPIGKASEA
jgi:hypothetical protein